MMDHTAVDACTKPRCIGARLAVHRDCLTRSSNTRAFPQLSLRVIIRLRWRWITMTVVIWEWLSDVLVCVKYVIWLVLSIT